MITNYAHRGASGYYPENTILSFQKALEMGCTGIETDVQLTRDGVLVLMHDEMVNRTTNSTGFIKDYSYRELAMLDAGAWMSEEYKGLKIPTAEELILLVKDKDIIINFEIKSGVIIYDGIEEKLIELIYKYGMEKKVILSSFNHYSMFHCKEVSQEIKTGLLYMEGLYRPGVYAKTANADAIHPNFYAIKGEIIHEVKDAGIMINTFTVNDINYMKYFVNIGVDGIITNYPDKLKNILES